MSKKVAKKKVKVKRKTAKSQDVLAKADALDAIILLNKKVSDAALELAEVTEKRKKIKEIYDGLVSDLSGTIAAFSQELPLFEQPAMAERPKKKKKETDAAKDGENVKVTVRIKPAGGGKEKAVRGGKKRKRTVGDLQNEQNEQESMFN